MYVVYTRKEKETIFYSIYTQIICEVWNQTRYIHSYFGAKENHQWYSLSKNDWLRSSKSHVCEIHRSSKSHVCEIHRSSKSHVCEIQIRKWSDGPLTPHRMLCCELIKLPGFKPCFQLRDVRFIRNYVLLQALIVFKRSVKWQVHISRFKIENISRFVTSWSHINWVSFLSRSVTLMPMEEY